MSTVWRPHRMKALLSGTCLVGAVGVDDEHLKWDVAAIPGKHDLGSVRRPAWLRVESWFRGLQELGLVRTVGSHYPDRAASCSETEARERDLGPVRRP